MKHKIIITESQYRSLMKNINEQWTPTLQRTSKEAPAWLSAIIGNKQDGYTFDLPPSTNVAEVDKVLAELGVDVETINEDAKLVAEVSKKLGERNETHFRVTMKKKNPKYRAMILKVYSNLKASTDGNITIMYARTKKTSKTEPTIDPGTKTPDEFKFPIEDNLVSKKYFVDNSWELDPEFVTQFRQTTLKKIKDKLLTMPKGSAGVLNGIIIQTSCSTLPNGKSPDGKIHTFAELSELRNESAKNFVLKELQSIGVTISPKLIYTPKWEGNLTGKYLGASSNSGDIWGQPGASKDRKVYESDKYLKIALDLNLKGGIIQKTDPKLTPGTYDFDYDYVAAFKVPEIPRRIPGIELAFVWNPKTQSKCKVGEPNSQMQCETWGQGPKDWSTNMKGKIHWGTED